MALESVEFYPMVSTNVDSIGYDYEDGVLYIKFVNQALYYYEGVPPQVYDEALVVSSIGRFVHTDLKGQYSYGLVS
jgi:hypothetical protein